MSCAAPPKQPRPEAASALAPGFRFHPTDEELVGYYLKRKVVGRPFRVDAISEIDLYKAEPWDLPGKSRIQSHDTEWYFFSALDKKYSNRSRTNRATGSGYWKTTGKDRAVCRGGRTVGMKKTLVFHIGRAPKGERTNWVMHEYRLEDVELARSGVAQDAFVVCRIFQKRGAGPQNGAQYGAPFVEEEWDDDDLPILKAEDEDDALSILGNPEPTETEDYNQIEDMGIQGAQTSLLLSTEQDGFNDFFDPDSLLKLCEENLLCDGKDGNIEIHGQQDGQHLEKEFGDCSVADKNQGFSAANDEFLELNDFAYPIDDNFLEDGYCPQEVDNGTNFMSGEISFQGQVQNVGDMSDPVNSSIQSVCSECHTVDDTCFVKFNDLLGSEDCNSVNQGNDGIVYLDAPNHFLDASHGYFKDTDSFVDSTIAESSDPDPVAELIAYFNATENMQPLDLDLTSRTNILDGSNLAPVNGHDIPYQASPKISSTSNGLSSMTPYTDNRPSVGSVNIHGQSEYGGSWQKAFKKRLMNMLDAVPSPPAFAAENPLKQAKSVEQYSASHTTSSMNVATGMIQIHGLTMSGTGKKWPMLKNRGPGFLLACTMGCDETDSFAAYSRMGKTPGGMMAFIMRNSFHLLFLSVLFLAASFKIWVCINGK